MSINLRKQLTLFLDKKSSIEIEKIRKEYNHIQFDLIKSHVTLCREDEIEEISKVINNLKSLNQGAVKIDFDKIVRFSDGKGVLISARENNIDYHNLRKKILEDSIIRFPQPHITLMHPRNSKCTDEIFEKLEKFKFPISIVFEKISLIEQINDQKWKIIDEFQI